MKRWMEPHSPIDFNTRQEIQDFLATVRHEELLREETGGEKSDEIVYAPFDPNYLDQAGWIRLGFTERQAAVIVKYTGKGGRFRRKEDLKKIYSVSESDYARVADYIVIADPTEQQLYSERKSTHSDARWYKDSPLQPDELTIEINSADSFSFQVLPGIGPAFAARIVRFRERLGGFHHPLQLLQVYGMDTNRFNGFAGQLEVDTSLIRRIQVNLADYEELRQHPLIGNKLAGVIVRYREHHGPFEGITDLERIQVVNENFLRNIAPYLEF